MHFSEAERIVVRRPNVFSSTKLDSGHDGNAETFFPGWSFPILILFPKPSVSCCNASSLEAKSCASRWEFSKGSCFIVTPNFSLMT